MGYFIDVICRVYFLKKDSDAVRKTIYKSVTTSPLSLLDHDLSLQVVFSTLGYNIVEDENKIYLLDHRVGVFQSNEEHLWKNLAPYVRGYLEYRGEDGQWWQYRFVNGEFEEKHLGRLFNDKEKELQQLHKDCLFGDLKRRIGADKFLALIKSETTHASVQVGRRKLAL